MPIAVNKAKAEIKSLEPMSEISPEIIGEREKFLLYGDPGMGKTHAALTIPDPIFFLSVGGKNEAKTYFSKKFQEKHGKKTIFLQHAIESIGHLGRFKNSSGFDTACRLLDEALELDDRGISQFDSIIIDNATVLAEYQMNKVVEISNTMNSFQENGILLPSDRDWGASQSLMTKFVSWLFSINKHIVLVAHEHETTVSNRATQSQDVVSVKPLFVGKQRDKIANAFDNVWRMTNQGQTYQARTVPQDKPFTVIAKTRVGGVVSNDLIDPNLTEVIAKFQKYASSVNPIKNPVNFSSNEVTL